MKSILRKLLPSSLILKLKHKVNAFDEVIYPFFAKTQWLSSFYYCFLSTQFRREHQSVLQGRLQYQQSLNEIKNSSVLLRRNSHRLEKGLIMKPRRLVFAEQYIDETVSCFSQCLNAAQLNQKELKWAQDVLVEYFSVVGSSSVIDKSRQQFNNLTLVDFSTGNSSAVNGIDSINGAVKSLPYNYANRVQSTVTHEQLFDLFKQRRSVRWYQQQKVEASLIDQAIEMAAQAPSACNRQPFQFYTITNMDKASDIASIAMGTTGFSDNIPALIVVVGNLSAYPAERDRHVIYIDGGLAAMQLMLAFETLGLSSCPINWPDIEIYEKQMANKLALPSYLRPIMLISVGYGDAKGQIPFSQKKSISTLTKEVS